MRMCCEWVFYCRYVVLEVGFRSCASKLIIYLAFSFPISHNKKKLSSHYIYTDDPNVTNRCKRDRINYKHRALNL